MPRMSGYVGTNYRIQIHHLRQWANGSSKQKVCFSKSNHKGKTSRGFGKTHTKTEAHGFLKSIFAMIQK